MPTPNPPANVIGSDNVSPVYNPDSRWQIWNMDEIYLGTIGAGKYIPKVGDEVHEIVGDAITRYIVIGINEVTLVAIMHQEDTSVATDALSENDILFGVGPGTQSDTYRIYIDKSVSPYRLAVDARLKVAGSNCHLAKIFKGANVGVNGIVISGLYNQNGQILSENIPLELVAGGLLPNHAIKTVAACHTTANLIDGDIATVVLYDTSGFVISKRQLIVENTGYIRSTDASKRYVTGISLETPFLSSTVDRQINYPLNVPLNAINLIGVVNYSDGSTIRMAVDGTRFSIAGLDSYAATIVGQKSQLVLKYVLGIDEVAYGIYLGTESHISEIYQIVTANSNGSYAVKLYSYPVWIDAVSGYRLEWFLYDLDRGISYNVTPQVSINTAQGVFDPKLYGVKQTLSVSVNLRDVNGLYKNFIHVQFQDIQLNKVGTARPNLDFVPNWNVSAVAGQTPMFGNNVFATYLRINANSWRVRLGANDVNLPAWLSKVYALTHPLFNDYSENEAPTPTHFKLTAGLNVAEYSIDDWNADILLTQTLTNNSTVFVKFIKRTVDTDLQLSVAALPLFQVDSNSNFV